MSPALYTVCILRVVPVLRTVRMLWTIPMHHGILALRAARVLHTIHALRIILAHRVAYALDALVITVSYFTNCVISRPMPIFSRSWHLKSPVNDGGGA